MSRLQLTEKLAQFLPHNYCNKQNENDYDDRRDHTLLIHPGSDKSAQIASEKQT